MQTEQEVWSQAVLVAAKASTVGDFERTAEAMWNKAFERGWDAANEERAEYRREQGT